MVVRGISLPMGQYCIRFPGETQLNAPLLQRVDVVAPRGFVKVKNLWSNELEDVGDDQRMLPIYL